MKKRKTIKQLRKLNNRKVNREAALDNGWKVSDSPHRNKKKYTRKSKHLQ